MDHLKSDIINGAYSRMRISGLTQQPSPEDIEVALLRLEQMAAEFEEKNICVGYNFSEVPDVSDLSGIPLRHHSSFELLLADRLFSDFGKQPDQVFMRNMRGSFSSLVSSTAPRRETQYPNRMPLGKITRYRYRFYNKFYIPEDRAPIGCETNRIVPGEINDYTESFESYLRQSEDISSFSTEVSDSITLLSSGFEGPIVSYRIQVDTDGNNVNRQSVIFTVTTSTGRITKRRVFFEIMRFDDA